MREPQERRLVSVPVMLITALAAVSVTWLCVGWIGAQGPLAAAATVVLAELFLACCGAAALLLTARLAEAYLRSEARAERRPPRRRHLWLWRRIWQPALRSGSQTPPTAIVRESVDHWLRTVYDEMRPVDATDTRPVTLPFQSRSASDQPVRRFETDANRSRRRAA